MTILYHPAKGTILTCKFDRTFKEPEMVKRRPVIVISPQIKSRRGLCTIVCCSTSRPEPVMPYHHEMTLLSPLPRPWTSPSFWIKGDMVYSVSYERLDLIGLGKDEFGKRQYHMTPISDDQLKQVYACVLHRLGLSALTKHLAERKL
jgi:mRNA interferase MazF